MPVFFDFSDYFNISIWRYRTVVYHSVTFLTHPRKVDYLIDFVNRQFVINVVTSLVWVIVQTLLAAFTLTFIPVKGIFSIHKVLEIVFALGIYRQFNL